MTQLSAKMSLGLIKATLAASCLLLGAAASAQTSGPPRLGSGDPGEGYSPTTNFDDAFCETGNYPSQWVWNPATEKDQAKPATSGTPRMVQIRNGVVIATYNNLGGDAGYSKPNSKNGEDPSVGPFRRTPYTQWQDGDIFEIYPAVYSGPKMQIYIGPNVANHADYTAGIRDVPTNITIRGVTVNGVRPVIVNPSSGASNSNFGQSLIYIHGHFDKDGNLRSAAKNITIENLDIVDNAAGGYIGKAAIYAHGADNLTLRNVRVSGFRHHSANGIFSTSNMGGTLLLENVELDGNGGANGPEHNAYINASKHDPNFTFLVRGSLSRNPYYGHALKSRAQKTIIEGSYLAGSTAAPGTRTETYLLDVPNGGVLIAKNNVFVKGYSGNNSNGASITFGVEQIDNNRAWNLSIEHNTFVAFSKYYDEAQHELYPLYIRSGTPGSKTVDSNLFVGYCPSATAHKNYRGTNFLTATFNDIDLGFRPRMPSLTGWPEIVGAMQYQHRGSMSPRQTRAIGARD